MLSPDVFIGNLREENRELKESIIALDGQKSLLQQQKRDGKQNLAALENQLSELDGQIAGLRQKREDGADLKALEDKRTELLLRRDEMLSETPKEPSTAQLDLNIRRAEAELVTIGQRQYQSKYTPEIVKLQAELTADGEAYRRACGVHQNIRPGVTCPTCLRNISEADNIDGIKAELNQAIQGMVQRGREKRAQLQEIMELDKKALAVFEQFISDDVAKVNERITRYQSQRETILAQPREHEESLSALNRQIAAVEADIELGGLTAEEKAQLDGLVADREKLSADYTAMKSLTERPEPDVDAQKKKLEEAIRHNDDLITAAMDYLGARSDLTFRGLPLDKVAFSLFDIFKTTGEVKNAFRFTYNGRDYRKLSHSEKIFAGMEVSELIKALTKRNYPVFVDDSESVVSLAAIPSGQVLLSRVTPNQGLTVVGKGRVREEMKKAS